MSAVKEPITKALRREFSHLPEHRIQYMGAKVRKLVDKVGIRDVEVGARPFQPLHGAYYTHTDLTIDGTVIYLRFKVA